MKRPLALTGFTSFGVLMAVVCFGYELAIPIACVSILLFAVSMLAPKLRKKKVFPLAFVTAFLCGIWIFVFLSTSVYPVWSVYDNVEAQVVAVQKSPGYRDGTCYYNEFETLSINGEKVKTGLTISTRQPIFTEPYDRVTINCVLEKNDYPPSLAKGNYLISRIYEDPQIEKTSPDRKPLMYYVFSLNSVLEDALHKELSPESGDFASALLLGNKHAMSQDVKDLFKVCGISHIVVVSGLHLSIVASAVSAVISKLSKNKYINALVVSLTVVGFAALTGFGFSVTRAMIMQIVIILSTMFRRRVDGLSSLGLAALVILIPNPLAVADVGFQLSFLATLGIVLWSRKMSDYLLGKLRKLSFFRQVGVKQLSSVIITTFTTTVSAMIFTLPVMILTFKGVSGVAVITNMIVVPFMTAMLLLVASCGIFHFVPFMPILSDICSKLTEHFYTGLIFICEALSTLPFSYINTEDSYFVYWIIFTVILSIAGAVIIQKYKKKIGKGLVISSVAVVSALFLFISSATYNQIHKEDVDFRIYNTGSTFYAAADCEKGVCILSAYGSKNTGLIFEDNMEFVSGTESNILINNGGKNSDDVMISLSSVFDYERVLLYDNMRNDEYGETVAETYPQAEIFSDLYKVDLWDLGTVTIIPMKKYSFEYINVYHSSVLIIPKYADIMSLPEEYRCADVIIAPEIPENMELLSCKKLILPEKYREDEGALFIAHTVAEEVLLETDTKFAIKR